MRIIKKLLKLGRLDYYKKHLFIINYILPVQMTPKEIEVLAAFMSLEGDIVKDSFGSSGRKIVMDKLNIQPGGLGNYLSQLKDKGFIIENKDTKELSILPILIPNNKEQIYQFKLVQDELEKTE